MNEIKNVIGRYAPSPSGPLHLGNLRTALLAWLQARLASGRFILRMEDIDTPRMRADAAEQIIEDLQWLGIEWDEGPDRSGATGPYTQSERTIIYNDSLQKLRDNGALFPCFCSRKDVMLASSAPHGVDGAVYPGTCREHRDTPLHILTERYDKAPSWRFRVYKSEICFYDKLQGHQRQRVDEAVGDFIVRRADGLFAYQFAVVIDDALMNVTDVVRGADLLSSTPRQIALFEAMGFSAPTYWHAPLMCDAKGQRLAKRDGALSVAELRDQGLTANQIVGQLAHSAHLTESDEPLSCRELFDALSLDEFTQRLHTVAREESP